MADIKEYQHQIEQLAQELGCEVRYRCKASEKRDHDLLISFTRVLLIPKISISSLVVFPSNESFFTSAICFVVSFLALLLIGGNGRESKSSLISGGAYSVFQLLLFRMLEMTVGSI